MIEPFKCRKCEGAMYIFEVYPPVGDPIQSGDYCDNEKCDFYRVLMAS